MQAMQPVSIWSMRPRAPLVCSVSRDSHLPRGHLTHPEPSHQRTQGGGCCLLRFSVKLLCPTKQLSLGVPPAVLSTSGTPYGLGWSCFHRVLPRTWPWLGSKESFSESQGAPPPQLCPLTSWSFPTILLMPTLSYGVQDTHST